MWTHPYIVGVHFPFKEYDDRTLKFIEALRESPYTISSFEMKKSVDTSHLREYYFQAISNSSWANEGYLIAESISRDTEFPDDPQRLVDINPDFRDFIDNVTRSAQIKDVHGKYDGPIDPDHYGDYLRKHGFPVSE